MFDFGDELIIDSYRIPWLVWIQLVVMILLLVLLYSLSISPSDLSLNSISTATATATATAVPSTSFAANHHPLLSSSTATSLHPFKVGGKQVKEAGPSTSRREVQRRKKEGSGQREGEDVGDSSVKDVDHGLVYGESYHPCNFIGLAKQAFLKCLGLGSESDNPPIRSKREKDE